MLAAVPAAAELAVLAALKPRVPDDPDIPPAPPNNGLSGFGGSRADVSVTPRASNNTQGGNRDWSSPIGGRVKPWSHVKASVPSGKCVFFFQSVCKFNPGCCGDTSKFGV